MPTGYTADVGDGKVTDFRTFALRCARQFGACIMQRDDPMDEPPKLREASPHYRETLSRAGEDLARILTLTDSECETEATLAYEAALAKHVRTSKNRKDTERRYRDMLAEVRAWAPPSPDHQKLKDFMVQQLTESIDFDCEYRPDPPKRLTGAEWKHERRKELARDIAYYSEAEQEEIERVNNSNTWITTLYESLTERAIA